DRAVGRASDDARVWVRVPDHAAGAARAPGGFAAPADDAPLADRAVVVLPENGHPGGGAGPQAGGSGSGAATNRVNAEVRGCVQGPSPGTPHANGALSPSPRSCRQRVGVSGA